LDTEVVSVRVNKNDKLVLKRVAKKEFRTFAEQVRMIIHKWVVENIEEVKK